MGDPATPALVVNQTNEATCKTEPNGIVTCESNATIVTKDLKETVQVTCVTHFDDRQTVMTSKRACVVLVPHGYRRLCVTAMVVLVVLWLIGVTVVLIFVVLIRRQAKKDYRAGHVNGGFWSTLLLLTLVAACVSTTMSGELSTEDPHIVSYMSDTITLPCEHNITKANLEAVLWRKDTDMIVAEYDVGDEPPVAFYDSMAGRGSAKVFPPTLKFSSASLEDAGVYQCEVLPLKGEAIVHRYTLTVNAKPFNETIRLNGRSYQDCEEVYLSESTDAHLALSCTASSKPSSRLSWTANLETPALVVNQSIAAECNTAANGIVTCESNATIVTKDLKDVVQVTCVTHFDDGQTVMTSKRACVVLVSHGYCDLWLSLLLIVVIISLFGVAVVVIFICIIWRLAKKENTAAPVNWRHLALGLVLVTLLSFIGVIIFIFLTFYWKLLPVPGKKAEMEKSGEELGEQEGLRKASNIREEGTNKESADKEEQIDEL